MAIQISNIKKVFKSFDSSNITNKDYMLSADGTKIPAFSEGTTTITGSVVADDTITIDFANTKSTTFIINLSNSTTSVTIQMQNLNQVTTANTMFSYNIILKNGTAALSSTSAVTWKFGSSTTLATTVSWPGGSAGRPPSTVTANAIDIWTFFTYDQGATLVGSLSMKNVKSA